MKIAFPLLLVVLFAYRQSETISRILQELLNQEIWELIYSCYSVARYPEWRSALRSTISNTDLAPFMYERLSVRDSLLVLAYDFATGEEVVEDATGFSYAVTKDTTFTDVFRQAAVDSIRSLLTGLENMRISGSNLCISSGSIITLDVSCDGKPTQFWLANTYDSTALGIVTIVNTYLPEGMKLHIPYSTWEVARNCDFARSVNRRKPIGEEGFPK